MEGDETAATITRAEGLAELGLYHEAWETIESLPHQGRVTVHIITVRLMVCIGIQAWVMGTELSKLILPGHPLKARETCGKFLIAHADHLHYCGQREAALERIKYIAGIWPEGKEAALASKVMQANWP